MRRRVVWRYGDSSPIFGHLVTAVDASGDGEIKIITGFPVSAAMVAFASSYNRYLIDQYSTYGYGYDTYAWSPTVHVSAVDDDGFYVCYQNIADVLDINYYVT
jgi:hypothetical protein